MKTIRTEKKGYETFEEKRDKYIADNNVYLVYGHTHRYDEGVNHLNIDSAGYNSAFHYIDNTLVVADLHLGVDKCVKKQEFIISELLKEDYDQVIFLGDTFEMALFSNDKILDDKTGFWTWLFSTNKKVIFVWGNHDINIKNALNRIRKILLSRHNTKIVEYYDIGRIRFIHGHQFDKYCSGWYLKIFSIADYLNLPVTFVDWFIEKFFGRKRN